MSLARPRLRYRPSFPFSSATLVDLNDAGNNATNVPRLSSAVLVSGYHGTRLLAPEIKVILLFSFKRKFNPCSLNRVFLTFSIIRYAIKLLLCSRKIGKIISLIFSYEFFFFSQSENRKKSLKLLLENDFPTPFPFSSRGN